MTHSWSYTSWIAIEGASFWKFVLVIKSSVAFLHHIRRHNGKFFYILGPFAKGIHQSQRRNNVKSISEFVSEMELDSQFMHCSYKPFIAKLLSIKAPLSFAISLAYAILYRQMSWSDTPPMFGYNKVVYYKRMNCYCRKYQIIGQKQLLSTF